MGETANLPYLNKSEIENLIDLAPTNREKLLLLTLYELGCTLNELANIRVRDINLETNQITISNIGARGTRICIISNKTKNLIKKYFSYEGLKEKRLAYLFISSHGGHMTVRRITQIIKNTLQKSGFKNRAHPQVLKYSHIINAYHSNVPPSAIKLQIGITDQRLAQILIQAGESGNIEDYRNFLEAD